MDKNIAALLRQNCRTVECSFRQASTGERSKLYIYICDFSVKPGDYAVVAVGADDDYRVVRVETVHDSVQIEPNSEIRYKWLICKVDVEQHLVREVLNAEIEDRIRKNYQEHIRRSFADQILASLPHDERVNLTKLLEA